MQSHLPQLYYFAENIRHKREALLTDDNNDENTLVHRISKDVRNPIGLQFFEFSDSFLTTLKQHCPDPFRHGWRIMKRCCDVSDNNDFDMVLVDEFLDNNTQIIARQYHYVPRKDMFLNKLKSTLDEITSPTKIDINEPNDVSDHNILDVFKGQKKADEYSQILIDSMYHVGITNNKYVDTTTDFSVSDRVLSFLYSILFATHQNIHLNHMIDNFMFDRIALSALKSYEKSQESSYDPVLLFSYCKNLRRLLRSALSTHDGLLEYFATSTNNCLSLVHKLG